MDFLLDPDVIYLNHGSFGAASREVFDVYQKFQRRLESNPMRFFQREMPELLIESRRRLGQFIGCDGDDLVLVPNPTFAANTVAKSLDLGAGDELLTTNHEYGACMRAWRYVNQTRDFQIVEHPFSLPVGSREKIVDQLWSSVTNRTKIIFLSHITSPTALEFPVQEICDRAREAGILTIVDGAHAPGQRPLDISRVGADVYLGACHKWMCAPKGVSFLYVSRDLQPRIEPLIVGWGWGEERQFNTGNAFQDAHVWLGTRDLAAYLSLPAAIDFLQKNNWMEVQARCHELAVEVSQRGAEVTETQIVHRPELFHQMALIEAPQIADAKVAHMRFYDEHRIEVPVIRWNDQTFVRVSVQAYNTRDDIDAFVLALGEIIIG